MRRRKPAIGFVLAMLLIDTIGFGIVMPVLPELVMKLGGHGLAEATEIGGWLALAYAGMQFLCGPLMGNLGDRFGRRPVLLASLAAFGIDYLLMAFAPGIAWLVAGRLIAGACGASYGPATAALADLSAPEDRARVFGYVGVAFGLGFIIGPALGGLLGEISPRAPFIAAAALAGLNLVYGLIVLPETLPPEKRRPFSLARANPLGAILSLRSVPGVMGIAAVYFMWTVASLVYPSIWSFWGIAAFGWSPAMIGISLAWIGVCVALVQAFAIGPAVKRFGERRSAMIGIATGLAGFVAFALVRESWMAFLVMTLVCIDGLAQPSLAAMLSRRVPDDAQGEAQGFMGSMTALASIPAPLLFNWPLAHFTGTQAPFFFPGAGYAVAAILCVFAIGLLLMVPRELRTRA
jgi:DHA1 family tetracycline resistance protein-like MFS transporter